MLSMASECALEAPYSGRRKPGGTGDDADIGIN
jgi:hypothetical protein